MKEAIETQIKALIRSLEKAYVASLVGSELIEAYYGEGENHIGDWDAGNFDDTLELGNRIGSYEVAREVCDVLTKILKEVK